MIIIPRRMLADEELARHLVGRYERVLIFAYLHCQFDQVVIIGVKRAQYQHPLRVQIEGLTALSDSDAIFMKLCPGDGRYLLPAAPEGCHNLADSVENRRGFRPHRLTTRRSART